MMLSVGLGLLSAVLYGVTDFIARQAVRGVGVLTAMVYGQWFAAALLSLILLRAGVPTAGNETWALLLVGNAMVLGATGFLYSAFRVGKLAVVAPIAASYGGVTAILSALSGEPIRGSDLLGLALILAGAVLVSMPDRDVRHNSDPDAKRGTVSAVLAAMLYGAGFWIQGRFAVAEVGPLTTVWSYYVVGAIVLSCIAWRRQGGLETLRGHSAAYVFGTAAASLSAYLALAAGQALGSVAVVTMLSSLASAVAVLLGVVLLKDKVPGLGWMGLGSIAAGLMMLHTA